MRSDEKPPAPLSAAEAPGTSEDAGAGGIAVPGASGAATGDVETREETALRGLEDVRITATFERADAMYQTEWLQMPPLERVPRIMLSAETPLETKGRLLREKARSEIGRFLGPLQGEWQGQPVALPDIPEWGEPRGIPEVRGSFTMSPEDGAAFTAWAEQVLARAAPPPAVAKRARELEAFYSRARCKGSTKCKVCRTFRCGYCHKRRPWCVSSGDVHPTWCDQCWRRRHRFAARRCWKCDPAGTGFFWTDDLPEDVHGG